METTIQISRELLGKLRMMKFSERESYENIIWDLIEDRLELSEETKKEIAEARAGKSISHEEAKKRLGR